MSRVIGIDLGTSTTVAAVAQADPQVIINELGSRQTPSMVGFTRKGDRVIGEFAKRQLMADPDRTLHSLRRFLGRSYDEAWEDIRRVNYTVVEGANGAVVIKADGRCYTPESLVGMILRAIRHSAEEVLGEKVTAAVITAPIGFSNRQRNAIRDAATLAGLHVIRIINEPTAAALAYMAEHKKPATLAIYDLGGASFDITLVRVDAQGVHTLATSGRTHLGGWDVDQAIIQWLIEEFFTRHRIDVSREPMAMQRLRDAAERAKQELSSAEQTEIRLPFLAADESGPKHIEKTLTRAAFEDMVEDLLLRTLKSCDKAMKAANLQASDIDDVLLIGGSAHIPKVQAMVAKRFNRPHHLSKSPEEIVAIGAATQAWLYREPTLPGHGAVTRLSLGIEGPGGLFMPVIENGASLPVSETTQLDISTPHRAGEINIHVLHGLATLAKDNTPLGRLTLPPSNQKRGPLNLSFTLTSEDGLDELIVKASFDGHKDEATLALSPYLFVDHAPEKSTPDEDETPQILSEADLESQRLRDVLSQHLASLVQIQVDYKTRLSSKELSELDAALKRGQIAMLKTSERPAYFQEIANYLFQFHTNLSAKLG